MVQYIPAPDPRTLLPPLLACLPTAFASPRPPPALLPLLSPILRQRVQLLSSTSSSTDSWLPLLCWDTSNAEKLPAIIESDLFELHPVSGEIEFKDVERIRYRRLDPETLHAQLVITDLSLVVTYLWCIGDEEGGGTGWRVSELGPSHSTGNGEKFWASSITEADDTVKDNTITVALREAERSGHDGEDATEEDDDQYWAQYDIGLDPDPTKMRSSEPQAPAVGHSRSRATSEANYYAQYARVQPALDSDDPSVQREELTISSLNGDLTTSVASRQISTSDSRLPTLAEPSSQLGEPKIHITHPQPMSSADVSSAVERLEHTAASLAQSERAARQHISSTMKSLFRLARNTGIDRREFERLIKRELETLSMLEGDD